MRNFYINFLLVVVLVVKTYLYLLPLFLSWCILNIFLLSLFHDSLCIMDQTFCDINCKYFSQFVIFQVSFLMLFAFPM